MPIATFARKLASLLLIILISAVLGELALRLVHRIRPSYIFYDDSYNRFRARPGSDYHGFPINSQGFHDTEFGEKTDGDFRIVALGDSFAFGVVPYEDNYLTLLERRLDAVRPVVEVLNMGIPRTAPADYLSLLVTEGFELEPDLVLVSVYIGNDLIETYRSLHRERSLADRSYLISLLRFAFRLRQATESTAVYDHRAYNDESRTFSRASYIEILGNRAKVYMVGWDGLEESVDAAVGAIERIAELCRRRGIEVAVVLIPEETQLDPELQAALPATYKLYREHEMDYLQPNRILAARLDALGLPWLDLYPASVEAARSERLYKPYDSHWGIAGNRLGAREIAAFLLDRGLVPTEPK